MPFTEISLTLYPSKREDMLSLCDRLSQPQVFFNDQHIGGAEETIQLLQEWDNEEKQEDASGDSGTARNKSPALKRYENEVASQPDPTDPRLQLPTDPPVQPKKQALPREESDHIIWPRSESDPNHNPKTLPQRTLSVLELVERYVKPSLTGSRRVRRFQFHENSFTGAQAVTKLASLFHLDPKEAVQFGHVLLQRKILRSVMDRNDDDSTTADFHKTSKHLFRLQCYHELHILNSYRFWDARVDQEDPMGVLNRCQSLLGNVESSVTDKTGSVDYEAAVRHEQYAEFEEAICELQGIDMSAFDPNTPISTKDPRATLVLKKEYLDCRIHYGLNCGAKSCPPVKKFTTAGIKEELRIVAMAFCEGDENIRIDTESRTVHLSQIFNWYMIDFASSKTLLPKAILSFLRGDKKQALERMMADENKAFKIKFFPYDWKTNASAFKAYRKSNLRSDGVALLGMICC